MTEIWDKVQDDFLIARFCEKDTFSTIAQKMSLLFAPRSKNSIISRAKRLRLKRKPLPRVRKEKPEKQKIIQPIHMKKLSQPKPPKPVEEMPELDIGITIMELNSTTCRFMVAKHRYCGDTIEKRNNADMYCAHHRDICFNGETAFRKIG